MGRSDQNRRGPRLLKVILKEGVDRSSVASKAPQLKGTLYSSVGLRVSLVKRQQAELHSILKWRFESFSAEERKRIRVVCDYETGEPFIRPYFAAQKYFEYVRDGDG